MSIPIRSLRVQWVPWVGCVLVLSCTHYSLVPPVSDWEQAESDIRTGRGRQALPVLERLHRKSPKNYAVGRALVEAHVQAGSTTALADRLSEASTPVEHYMRALALFAQKNEITPALRKEFDQAIAQDPKRAEPRYRLGLALLESGPAYVQEALEPLRKASEIAPHRRAILLPLAKVLFETGDAPGAVAALGRAVALGPNREEVATARALMAARDPFNALPVEVRGEVERGLQALERDQPHEAMAAFDSVVQDRPELPAGHLLRGLALQRMGDAGEAAEALGHAEELDPGQALPQLYLGNLYWGQGQPETALAHYAQAIARNPVLDEAYFHQAEIALERADLELARRSFKTLTFLAPDDLGVRRKLAETLKLQGDFDAAEHELRVALGQEPNHVELRLRLAQLYAEQASKQADPTEQQRFGAQARKEAQRVLELEPENATALSLAARSSTAGAK